MTTVSDSKDSQPTDVGGGGTVRLGATVSQDAAGAQGTVRVGAAQDQGAAGTVRVGAAPDGPQGTARVDAGGQVAPLAVATSTLLGQAAPRASDPQRLSMGQIIHLNGCDYTVASALSLHTSEANTYVVSSDRGSFVLKRYKNGVRMPEPVLQRLKDHGHPNVVAVHDLGRVDGHDVELLEYVTGGSLADHLRRHGPVKDPSTLRKLVRGLADGLQHLHGTVRMIYQDLKPENILLADATMSRVMLADFGISTLMKPGSHEVDVTANGTREYAAPELSRFGNQTSVLVSPAVDYFALGVTLLECWTASRPFQGVLDSARSNQILGQSVPIPADMDENLAALVKGLIKPLAQDRFGANQVRRWLDGLALQVDYGGATRQYPVRWFHDDRSFNTPAQLAALLESDPVKGCDFLYLDLIKEWLDEAGDMTMAAAIRKIVQDYNRDEVSRSAGLVKAIFTLDSERPFITEGGHACRTQEELGDALLLEKTHYIDALRDTLDPFYLYLQANGAGDFADATFARFRSKKDSAELAFNSMLYALHEGGQRRLKLAGRYWFDAADFNAASSADRDALLRELRSADSRGLIWLQAQDIVDKLLPLDGAEPVNLLSMAKALPWLQLKVEIAQLDNARQARIALELLRTGRTDLFDEYLQQGLSLNVQDGKWSPLAWASGAGRRDEVLRLLDFGAQVDFTDSNSPTALDVAIRYRRTDVVELLLSRGADASQAAQDKETMLGLACRHLKLDGRDKPVDPRIVRLLLQAGAHANQATGTDVLPLHLVMADAEAGDVVDLFDALIAAGASISARGMNLVMPKYPNCDALFCALYAYKFKRLCDANFLPVIERLVKGGASLHAVDNGLAPLHFAASIEDEPLVRLLLQLGARTSQVVDGDMLPATYAAVGKAPALAALLEPGAGLRMRQRTSRLTAWLGRLLALTGLALNLIPLGAIGTRMMANTLMAWGMVWLGCLLLLGGLGLISAGSLSGFKAGLKQGMKGRGWFQLLVVLPLMVAAVAVAAHHIWLRLGGVLPWYVNRVLIDWPLLLPAVALAAIGLSMSLSRRAGPLGRAFGKLDEALSGRTVKKAQSAKGSGLKGILVGLGLALGVLYIASEEIHGLSPFLQRDEPQSSLLGSTEDPSPNVVALAAKGELMAAYPLQFGKTTLCTLPAGTKVGAIKPLPRNDSSARYQVVVPKPGGDCAEKLIPGLVMRLPVDVISYPGKPAARNGASSRPPSSTVPNSSAKAAALSGTVSGLSPDGWPVIDGKPLPLFGVAAIAPSQTARFDAWLSANQHRLECESRPGNRWRCFNSKNADVALGLLLNGVARAADDAPVDYRQAMDKAVSERRGQWK